MANSNTYSCEWYTSWSCPAYNPHQQRDQNQRHDQKSATRPSSAKKAVSDSKVRIISASSLIL